MIATTLLLLIGVMSSCQIATLFKMSGIRLWKAKKKTAHFSIMWFDHFSSTSQSFNYYFFNDLSRIKRLRIRILKFIHASTFFNMALKAEYPTQDLVNPATQKIKKKENKKRNICGIIQGWLVISIPVQGFVQATGQKQLQIFTSLIPIFTVLCVVIMTLMLIIENDGI